MRKLFLLVFALALISMRASAQDYPPPCSPNSPIYSECQGASPNCQPCWAHSCYDIDVNWNVVCNEYCDGEATDLCSPARQQVTSGYTNNPPCSYDKNSCPGPSCNYLCQVKDTVYDICTDTICSTGFTEQCACSQNGLLEDNNRAKTILARIRATRRRNAERANRA